MLGEGQHVLADEGHPLDGEGVGALLVVVRMDAPVEGPQAGGDGGPCAHAPSPFGGRAAPKPESASSRSVSLSSAWRLALAEALRRDVDACLWQSRFYRQWRRDYRPRIAALLDAFRRYLDTGVWRLEYPRTTGHEYPYEIPF